MKKHFLTYFMFAGLLTVSCEKDGNEPCKNVPVLITNSATEITSSSVNISGVITPPCDPSVISQGFVYSNSTLPKANHYLIEVSGSAISSTINNLSPNTEYFIRVYFKNAIGEYYGNEQKFKTDIGSFRITTDIITHITTNAAISGGKISAEGDAAITTRGVCWSTNADPTVSNSKTTDGTGAGNFTSMLTNLTANTPYYVRAYATNSQGTTYGGQVTFTTAKANPTGTFTDSRDSKTYKWVQIGTQVWMSENLAYLPAVHSPTSKSFTEPRYYVWGDAGTDVVTAKQNANYATYGVLYNWPAAKAACPPGWHLPSDAEWTILENYSIANGYNYDATTTGNKIAKSLSATTNWPASSYPSMNGEISGNLIVNNKSGFSALPGGWTTKDGAYSAIGTNGYWWSATESSMFYAWTRNLDHIASSLNRSGNNMESGFSVRCVRD